MRTNVYIDGFNLYYGCLKDTQHKWLNVAALCQSAFPNNSINRIRYFTARVSSRPNDPQQPERQNAYLRALETIPNLTIHLGKYLSSPTRMPLASPVAGGPNTVQVIKTEEKGSDVNIATYLLTDAFDAEYEAAIVISNDSDLVTPIVMVRKKFKLKVVCYHPCRPPRLPSGDLTRVASKSVVVDTTDIATAQFPNPVVDSLGRMITKPATW